MAVAISQERFTDASYADSAGAGYRDPRRLRDLALAWADGASAVFSCTACSTCGSHR